VSKWLRRNWPDLAHALLGALAGAGRSGSALRATLPDLVSALVGRRRKGADATEIALGVALASGLALAGSLYERPGVRASVRSAARLVLGRDPERRDEDRAADATAARIVRYLAVRRVVPVRVAVDGLPGSGKTALSRALGQRLGLRHVSLDHRDLTRTLDLGARDAIYEHHRLLRTQDLDGFDVLCYFDLPVREVRRRLEERERGAFLSTVFDFTLMKRIGDVAFALCDGRAVDMGAGVKLKLRPPAGYRAAENLALLASRLGVEGPELSREELMFLGASGRAREGLLAYLNGGELREHLRAAAIAGLRHL
jgi:hypothetical protein